jgi:hypothetical protein
MSILKLDLIMMLPSIFDFLLVGKGQLISKCLLSDIVSTKKPTKFF